MLASRSTAHATSEAVGATVGATVATVGATVGATVATVGATVGATVVATVGATVVATVGATVASTVGAVGATVELVPSSMDETGDVRLSMYISHNASVTDHTNTSPKHATTGELDPSDAPSLKRSRLYIDMFPCASLLLIPMRKLIASVFVQF